MIVDTDALKEMPTQPAKGKLIRAGAVTELHEVDLVWNAKKGISY